jgi:predicted RNA-binding Zn ribbon-like protein
MAGRQVEVIPAGAGAAWLESAIGAELLLAEEHGDLRRLKLCRNDACAVAFYDQSKNNSRVWHDMASCGTPLHVREYRKRKQKDLS